MNFARYLDISITQQFCAKTQVIYVKRWHKVFPTFPTGGKAFFDSRWLLTIFKAFSSIKNHWIYNQMRKKCFHLWENWGIFCGNSLHLYLWILTRIGVLLKMSRHLVMFTGLFSGSFRPPLIFI